VSIVISVIHATTNDVGYQPNLFKKGDTVLLWKDRMPRVREVHTTDCLQLLYVERKLNPSVRLLATVRVWTLQVGNGVWRPSLVEGFAYDLPTFAPDQEQD